MRRSEEHIRKKLTAAKYTDFLNERYPKEAEPGKDYEWNPKTGSCGYHGRFTKEALGVSEIGDEHTVTLKDIQPILKLLDKGEIVQFLHSYLEGDKVYFDMPKDNRYDSHVFILVKGGDRYFLSQGFLHVYKHSLTSFTREELEKMLFEIIEGLSDFDKNKTWSEMNSSVYKKYFKANLGLSETQPFQPHRKVNGVGFMMWRTRASNS